MYEILLFIILFKYLYISKCVGTPFASLNHLHQFTSKRLVCRFRRYNFDWLFFSFKTMIFLVIMISWKKHFRTLVFKISWGCKITTIATNRCKLFEIFVSVIFFSFLFSSVCALAICVKICIYICNMGYCNFKSYSSLQSTGLMELPKISKLYELISWYELWCLQ